MMENMSPNSRQIIVWTEGETKILLEKYANYLPNVGPMKKFKNKKKMWQQLALDIEGKNPKQCEERYKTVMKRKKTAVENNHTSGAKRQHVEFQQELEQILAIDDSIEPEVQLSSQKMLIKQTIKSKNPSSSAHTMSQTLADIAKTKEEHKERRHQEKMKAIGSLHSLLEKSLQQNSKK